MIHDTLTIIRHEWRGFFRYGESRRSGWIRWGAVAFLSFMIARSLGPEFGAAWPTVLAATIITLIFIPAVVADSFAGERERHTLETILASRISDGALLLGKYMANLIYGWSVALLFVGVGVGAAYLRYNTPAGIYQPSLAVLGAAAVISLLGAGVITGVGVLVSLRAPTVKRATESLAFIMIGIALLPEILSRLPLPGLKGLTTITTGPGAKGPGASEFLLASAALLTLDLILLGIAWARFRRAKLID